jgi:hypothetical protein
MKGRTWHAHICGERQFVFERSRFIPACDNISKHIDCFRRLALINCGFERAQVLRVTIRTVRSMSIGSCTVAGILNVTVVPTGNIVAGAILDLADMSKKLSQMIAMAECGRA